MLEYSLVQLLQFHSPTARWTRLDTQRSIQTYCTIRPTHNSNKQRLRLQTSTTTSASAQHTLTAANLSLPLLPAHRALSGLVTARWVADLSLRSARHSTRCAVHHPVTAGIFHVLSAPIFPAGRVHSQ